jgi:hypothetical protein
VLGGNALPAVLFAGGAVGDALCASTRSCGGWALFAGGNASCASLYAGGYGGGACLLEVLEAMRCVLLLVLGAVIAGDVGRVGRTGGDALCVASYVGGWTYKR